MDCWNNLTKEKKIALVSGTVAATVLIAYVGYKILSKPKLRVYQNAFDEDEDFAIMPEKKKSEKEIYINLMDESILESMDAIYNLLKVSIMNKDAADIEKAQSSDEIQFYIESIISSNEEKLCQQNKIDGKNYFKWINSNRRDREVKRRQLIVNNIIQSIIYGQMPHIDLQCDPRLTDPLTITLYRWIIALSYYKTIWI